MGKLLKRRATKSILESAAGAKPILEQYPGHCAPNQNCIIADQVSSSQHTPGRSNPRRPAAGSPLGDDDCTGLRAFYPDPADAVHLGSIQGRILPANPLALPASPPGVKGVFGAHIIAVDAASGAAPGATMELCLAGARAIRWDVRDRCAGGRPQLYGLCGITQWRG